MRRRVAILTIGVTLFAGISARSASDLTAKELADILQVHTWRVPLPPHSKIWNIETVSAGSTTSPKRLPTGPILIALRPLSDETYEFVLMNKAGQSTGTFRPCAEPKEVPSICEDGYSISFKDPPVCVSDCSTAIVAEITPMIGEANKRWIIISQLKAPVVPVDSKNKAVPVR
ncbi:MAG: hypothetical protein QOC70_489 [Verrucomicrobiota bacterium]|jgi:hypothetical protein